MTDNDNRRRPTRRFTQFVLSRLATVLVIAAAIGATVPAMAGNLVQNGSFEQPSIGNLQQQTFSSSTVASRLSGRISKRPRAPASSMHTIAG